MVNATYQTQDGGDQIFKDVELPFATHPEAAQRIAKILLEKARQGLVVHMPVNHHAIQFAAYDVVTLTNDQLGWSAKPFRVNTWTMNPGLSIGLVLQEESAASYDWNSGGAMDDDPAGSPAWGEWRQFFVGDYTCRAYEFRLFAESTDATTNVAIAQLGVTVDVPDIIDSGTLTTSASGPTAIAFSKTFVVAPDIGVGIRDAASGEREEITAVTTTGFHLGVKDAGGGYVARDVGWVSIGY